MNEMQRNHKDTVFRRIFMEKENLLSLYNAVNGTSYENPEELEITTLEDAFYMNIKNDISCVLDSSLNLYEHQSTVNPNIPLRDLFYVSRIYRGITMNEDLYSSKQITIPIPHFFMFYNGTKKMPEQWELKLSDAWAGLMKENKAAPDSMLELTVHVFNINLGKNERLMNACRKLEEYSRFVDKVRRYIKETVSHPDPIKSKKECICDAIDHAVTECVNEGILADFLKKNRAEAVEMSWYKYNEELHIQNERKIAMEEGIEIQRKYTEIQRKRAEKAELEAKKAKQDAEQLKRENAQIKQEQEALWEKIEKLQRMIEQT